MLKIPTIDFNNPKHRRRLILTAIAVLLLILVITVALIFRSRVVDRFERLQASQSNNTVFYDLDQRPFHIIQGTEDRRYVKLDQISRSLQLSVVAIEDGRFFHHFGFDPIRIVSVILRLFKPNASLQGASTITQQLVKLTLLSPEITLNRKIKEIFMATALESKYTKARILEFYLNKVYLGHGNYGVENASLNFFHKSASDLTLAESALIAGLIKKPEGYSPFADIKQARLRQILVLKRLRKLEWITQEQYLDAVKERLVIRQRKRSETKFAPYFTNHIILELNKKYGHRMIYGGGLRIYTTLDHRMQKAMNDVVENRMLREGSFTEVAGVSIDPATGHVKAMVGGVDFLKSEFNRVTQARRQPGSSFKPVLYATALTEGIKTYDTYSDEPTQYTRVVDDELEIYQPGNYSGDHLGQITMAYALRVSNNVVSVQILNQIGIPALLRKARAFGIELPPRRGLCLALGCGETSLLRLTNAYSVFANQGLRNDPVFILKITDSEGNVLYQHEPQPEIRVLSEDDAYRVNHLLQEVVNHGTGRNAKIERVSAGKTGTSDDNRDAWFIGFTPELVTGFWIGNDDNTPMDNEVGGRTPAQLWKSYMIILPKPDIPSAFSVSQEFEEHLLCNQSGKLATKHCPSTSWYALKTGEVPVEYCPIHSGQALEIQICRQSGKLASEYCPLEDVVTERFFPGTEPEEFCDIHVAPDMMDQDQNASDFGFQVR